MFVRSIEDIQPNRCYMLAAIASAEGHLYTWGRGFKSNSDVYSPQHLPSPSSFSKVALGWNHALVLTGINIHFTYYLIE